MTENKGKTSVLFVCMGNICRSPTAEGVFRHIVHEAGLGDLLEIDSAGTHAYHVGAPPDRRAQEAASKRGFDLASLRARRVSDEDFTTYNYIIAMDEDNLRRLRDSAEGSMSADLRLFLDFSADSGREVPDPYYGGTAGFERVLDLIEDASQGLLDHIRRSNSKSGKPGW